jgi:hypothetical protein
MYGLLPIGLTQWCGVWYACFWDTKNGLMIKLIMTHNWHVFRKLYVRTTACYEKKIIVLITITRSKFNTGKKKTLPIRSRCHKMPQKKFLSMALWMEQSL